MTDALALFFDAWSEADAELRHRAIKTAMADEFCYSDPRSGGRLTSVDALSDYVGNFSASAPGWTATVENTDGINGFIRALVLFSGAGPDGAQMGQHGTYFAEADPNGRITRLAGFVGREAG